MLPLRGLEDSDSAFLGIVKVIVISDKILLIDYCNV